MIPLQLLDEAAMTQRFAKIDTRELARGVLMRKTENGRAKKFEREKLPHLPNRTESHAGINGAINAKSLIRLKQGSNSLQLSFDK